MVCLLLHLSSSLEDETEYDECDEYHTAKRCINSGFGGRAETSGAEVAAGEFGALVEFASSVVLADAVDEDVGEGVVLVAWDDTTLVINHYRKLAVARL